LALLQKKVCLKKAYKLVLTNPTTLEDPFKPVPDPKFFFNGKEHQAALQTIKYTVENNKGISVIVGDYGTGKTLILRKYVKDIDYKNVSLLTLENPIMGRKNILFSLVKQIEPSCEKGLEEDELHQILTEKLFVNAKRGKKTVLIVDDAQLLDKNTLETLRLLLNYQYQDKFLVTIILSAQLEFLTTLSKLPQFTQRIYVTSTLTNMSREEVKDYITHRLQVAGLKEGNIWTREAIHCIYEETKGLPRAINNLCDKALRLGYEKNLKIIEENTILELLGKYKKSETEYIQNVTPFIEVTETISSSIYKNLYNCTKNFKTHKNKMLPLIDDLISSAKENPDGLLKEVAISDLLYNGNTNSHIVNLCIISTIIGLAMNLPLEKLKILALASFYHDIGMKDLQLWNISDLSRKLNKNERSNLKQHPVKGAKFILKCLSKLDSSSFISQIVVQHHERVNGDGYPYGLKEGKILSESQILMIADTYEAMTHKRKYRDKKYFLPFEAWKILLSEDFHNLYNLHYFKNILEILTLYPPGYFVRLNTGKIARVLKRGNLVKPSLVEIVGNSNEIIDLSKEPMIYVKEGINYEESKKREI
jgi:general secretion pathway protein A